MKQYLILYFLVFLPIFFLHAQDSSTHITDSILIRTDSSLINDVQNNMLDNMPTMAINDDDLSDNDGGSVSSMLTAGRNPFLNAATFNFSVMRFKLRGYDNNWNNTYINGLQFNGLDNGNTPFGLWSGLSNMMRGRENTLGLQAMNFGFGAPGLNTNIDMRAGNQWQQTNLGYAFSNRTYQNRIYLSHSSGFNRKGWAYSVAASGNFAGEGYVPGTYTNNYSFYAAVDKKLNNKNTISLLGFYAPTERGRQSASVQEAIDLAGTHYYNPSWGYQNGKKRNANVNKSRQPVFILSHEFKPSTQSSLQTSVGYFFGLRSSSALDWNNVADPRPDYYRYLSNYYKNTDAAQADALTAALKANPNLLQIDWQHLYDVNRSAYTTIANAYGYNQPVSGLQSRYILGNRNIYTKHFMANINYSSRISDIIFLSAGANYSWQDNHYFQSVEDLLGGDFWLNINQFALRDYPSDNNKIQYDLDHPNKLVGQYGHYGYDYDFTYSKAAAWFQTKISLAHFDLFCSNEISYSQFYRIGNVRSGLFPDNSYGKGTTKHFVNITTKAGITYKLNGRNYFYFNAAYFSMAPSADNAYLSPRTRDDMQADIKNETIETLEGGYNLNSPYVKLHAGGYFTKSQNGMDVINFYADDQNSFGNYAINGINRLYFGGEFGTEVKLTQTLSLNAAAAIGRAYYDSRQKATLTIDNSGEVVSDEILYLKNYRISSTPQNAYSLGLRYNSPKYWFVSLTGNYMNNDWLSIDPAKHTASVINDIDPLVNNDVLHAVLQQRKLDDAFTLDLFAGWNKRLRHVYIDRKPVNLIFTVGVSNLTNNKNIRSGGYEQLRISKTIVQDFRSNGYDRFPPKYFYAYGLNYYISVAFRF